MSYFEKTVLGDRDDPLEQAKVEDDKLNVRSKDTESLLMELIRNIKVTNLHLSKMTGEAFTEEDIED